MSIIGPNNKEIVFLVQRECCQCNLVPPWHYDWFSMRGFFPVFLITVFKRRQNRMSNLFWNGRFPNSLRSIWPGLFLDFKQIIVSCSSTRNVDIKFEKRILTTSRRQTCRRIGHFSQSYSSPPSPGDNDDDDNHHDMQWWWWLWFHNHTAVEMKSNLILTLLGSFLLGWVTTGFACKATFQEVQEYP